MKVRNTLCSRWGRCCAHRALEVQEGVGHLWVQLHKGSRVLDDLCLPGHTSERQPITAALTLLHCSV